MCSVTVFIHCGDLGFEPQVFASAFLCQENKSQARVAGVSAGESEEGLLSLTPVADSFLCL